MSSDSFQIEGLGAQTLGKDAIVPADASPEMLFVATVTIADVDVHGAAVDGDISPTKAVYVRFKGTLNDGMAEVREVLLTPEDAEVLALGVANVLDRAGHRSDP